MSCCDLRRTQSIKHQFPNPIKTRQCNIFHDSIDVATPFFLPTSITKIYKYTTALSRTHLAFNCRFKISVKTFGAHLHFRNTWPAIFRSARSFHRFGFKIGPALYARPLRSEVRFAIHCLRGPWIWSDSWIRSDPMMDSALPKSDTSLAMIYIFETSSDTIIARGKRWG